MPVSLMFLYFSMALNSGEVQTARLEERVVQLQISVQQVQTVLNSIVGREAEAHKALVAYVQDRVNGPVTRQEFERHNEAQKLNLKEMTEDIRIVELLVKAAGIVLAFVLLLLGWMKIRVRLVTEP